MSLSSPTVATFFSWSSSKVCDRVKPSGMVTEISTREVDRELMLVRMAR